MIAALLIVACFSSQTATSTPAVAVATSSAATSSAAADRFAVEPVARVGTRKFRSVAQEIDERLLLESTGPMKSLGNKFLIGAGGGVVLSVGIGAISYFAFGKKLSDGQLRTRDEVDRLQSRGRATAVAADIGLALSFAAAVVGGMCWLDVLRAENAP